MHAFIIQMINGIPYRWYHRSTSLYILDFFFFLSLEQGLKYIKPQLVQLQFFIHIVKEMQKK